MRRTTQLFCVLGLVLLLAACSEPHFMTDTSYRRRVEQDFLQKQALMTQGGFFSIFNSDLPVYEREALEFLYAYMPLADITDYPGEFHLMNVRASRRAAGEMPWGRDIPEDVFRHFVLPVRVNNEHLDSARVVFYEELKDRVKSLSLQDAILEVNHWCHEKAVYKPSDARTSSPLATVRTAYGRCGEESTLLVAALRSVGIPARQVYTPRWAHTDDNHAWVEAWADGKWYFLGACEPEPVLNLGWFNAPASRGMLMHTKVFGRYEGTEEVMSVTPNYTEINVIDNYAPTAKASVTVVDADGKPVDNACVEFKLYNYAEFYTVAVKHTDAKGTCGLTAGKGDMLVWASKDGRFGFAKLSFGKQQELTVCLDKKEGDTFAVDIDIVPPPETANLPEVTPEQRAENDRRLAQEDSIRNAYTATFMTDVQINDFINTLKSKPSSAVRKALSSLLADACGNCATLCRFIAEADRCDKLLKSAALLQTLSHKDRRDVRTEVLMDFLLNTPDVSDSLYECYLPSVVCMDAPLNKITCVLSPRISTEELTPYRSFFCSKFTDAETDSFRINPHGLIEWVRQFVTINNEQNSQRIPISPEGVWRSRVADTHSRDIFFVALARSLGIPAYIDKVDGRVKYITPSGEFPYWGKEIAVDFDSEKELLVTEGHYWLCKPGEGGETIKSVALEAKYYSTFTVSRIKDGRLNLLEYDTDVQPDAGCAGFVEPGNYLLVTGTRLASGGVLARISSFQVEPYELRKGENPFSQICKVPYYQREAKGQVEVIGSFNSESLFAPCDAGFKVDTLSKQSLLQVCGRGYFVVGILGVNQEPTNHALRDIAALKDDLERWGRKLVLLFPDEARCKKFRPEEFPGLPSTVIYGVDTDGISARIAEDMKFRHKETLPVFIIADTFNRVVFVSQGYTIGLGEQLMKTVKGL